MAGDKAWVNGKWQLRYARRVFGLVKVLDDLRALRCGYFEVLVELLGCYRWLTERVDSGKYRFVDCKDLLMTIEDVFSQKMISAYFFSNRGRLSVEDLLKQMQYFIC